METCFLMQARGIGQLIAGVSGGRRVCRDRQSKSETLLPAQIRPGTAVVNIC